MGQVWGIWSLSTKTWCEGEDRTVSLCQNQKEAERAIREDFVFPMDYEARPYRPGQTAPPQPAGGRKKPSVGFNDLVEEMLRR
jgi:hypothetical protein